MGGTWDATGLRGAFCLIRLLPLLDAVGSEVRASVDAVIEALLDGAAVDDAVLIRLDDYREAAGEDVCYDQPPVSFERAVCSIAICAAGAETSFGRSPLENALSGARSLWRELGRLCAASGVRLGGVGAEGRFDREGWWQESDAEVAEAGLDDPAMIDRHVGVLRITAMTTVMVLARLAEALEWLRRGPCGTDCDWPSCASQARWCLDRRAFRPQQSLGAVLRRKHGEPPAPWVLRVLNFDAPDDEPWEIVSEIGADGAETRKIVHFIDGLQIPVGAGHDSGDFPLASGTFPLPNEWERAGHGTEELSLELFEEFWSRACVEFDRDRER